MPRSVVRRWLIAAAVRRPRAGYVAASLADQARDRAWRLRGTEPAGHPFWRWPTAYRERLFRKAFANPACAWPFPASIGAPDPASLTGPMVLVSFHLGTVEALGAVFERLPGPRLVLWACCPVERPGTRLVDIGHSGFVFAAKCALDTLRAGGFVFSVADGAGHSRVEAALCGRRIVLPRGTFTIARLAGAPLLPMAARWRGSRIEVTTGDLIPPGDEAEMVSALMGWLEPYLIEHPEEARGDLLHLLRTAPLSQDAIPQGVLEGAVPDLPRLR